jgi:hypothetical protein
MQHQNLGRTGMSVSHHLGSLGVKGLLLAGTLPDPIAYTRRIASELLPRRDPR